MFEIDDKYLTFLYPTMHDCDYICLIYIYFIVPNPFDPFERRLYKVTYNPRRHSAYATVPGTLQKVKLHERAQTRNTVEYSTYTC